ncbi:MAG: 50S ribosomal protein L11 methyltransferase [Victivallis sp.]
MNDMLYCIKLVDDSENFDLAAEMLAALELESSSFEDKENKRVCHTIYAADPETAAENLALVTNAVKEWTPLGVRISAIEPFELKKEDWAEVWKKYFDVIPVSETLVIKPSWLDVERKPGMAVVEIDPGMSFGTGQHATTYYCLKTIDRLAGKPGVKSMLDAGCGSGILTIAAALRGYDPVDAFDNDPDAVRIAAENLALNRIGTVVRSSATRRSGRAGRSSTISYARTFSAICSSHSATISSTGSVPAAI